MSDPNYITMRDWLEEHEPTPDDLLELIQAERERCAKIAESEFVTRHDAEEGRAGEVIADAIRRGEGV